MTKAPPQPTRRVKRGRGHSYLLDGEPCDGVTTILGAIAKPALINWAANTTAEYAIDRWAELDGLAPSERLKALKGARFENAAAARGTDVHELAARLGTGQEVDVPEHLTGYIDAYLAFVDTWGLEEVIVEASVINRKYRYMGTLDVIAVIRGEVWLLDWKTGATGIYPETTLQLSAYANAETYLTDAGEERPLPEVDRAGAVWLRADGADLIPCDAALEPATFRTFLYAQQIARFTAADRADYVGQAIPRPEVTA